METPNANGNQNTPPNSGNSNNPPANNSSGTPSGNGNANSTHTIHHEPINITIQPNQEEDRNAIEANRLNDAANRISTKANHVSIAGLIVAVAVFLFTYLLFRETQKANETSKNALQLNRDQFAQSKIDNETNRKLQDQKDSNAATEATSQKDKEQKRFDSQFALQQKTTQAQIEAFQRQEQRFETENAPYVQAGNFEFLDSLNGRPYVIRNDLLNVGKNVVHITRSKHITAIIQRYFDTADILRNLKLMPYTDEHNYIGPNVGMKEITPLKFSKEFTMQEMLANAIAIAFAGEYEYINPITKTKKIYGILVSIPPDHSNNITIIKIW